MFLVLLVCEEYVGISTRASFSDNAQTPGLGPDQKPAQVPGLGLVRGPGPASGPGLLEPGSLVFHCAQGKDRTGDTFPALTDTPVLFYLVMS